MFYTGEINILDQRILNVSKIDKKKKKKKSKPRFRHAAYGYVLKNLERHRRRELHLYHVLNRLTVNAS